MMKLDLRYCSRLALASKSPVPSANVDFSDIRDKLYEIISNFPLASWTLKCLICLNCSTQMLLFFAESCKVSILCKDAKDINLAVSEVSVFSCLE